MRWSAAALIVGSFASALAAAPAMFRADSHHGGIYDAAGVPVLHGVKWKFKTGAAIVSSPAISADTVYFGSSDHSFYAVDEHTGRLRWKFATQGRVTSSPAVAAGRV